MANPLIERELVAALRTPRAVAMQGLPALVCSLLVLLRWPAEGQADLGGQQSRQVFQLFGYGLLAAILLLVPAFPATTLVRERLQGTLALLLQTPLRPWSIYLGKLAGILGFAWLPISAGLPAAAACYVMGGISGGDILLLFAILALVTLQYTTMALFVSSVAGSSDTALRTTYGLTLALAFLTLAPHQVLQGTSFPLAATAATWARSLSPLPAVMEILGHTSVGGAGTLAVAGEPGRYALLALATSVVFMILTARRLKPTLLDRARPQGTVTEERGRFARLIRRLVFIVDPQRRAGLIGPFTNPVLVKEFRSRRFGRSHWMLRLVALCAVVSLGLTFLSGAAALDWGVGTTSALLVLMQGTLVVLLTPGLAAGLISGEIESGSWTLLQMTPLSAGRILFGKLLSVVWIVALILLATLPGYGVMIYAQPSLLQQVVYVLVSLLLTGLLALTLSAAVGSFVRRTAAATAVSYALLVGICVGPMLIWLGRDSTFGHAVVERSLALSPLAAALSVMEVPGFRQYHLVPLGWWLSGGASLACLVLLRVRVWQLTRPR